MAITELRKIAEGHGLKEADRILAEHAARVGYERCEALYAELMRLRDEPMGGVPADRPPPPKTDPVGWDGVPWLVGAIAAFMVSESVRNGHYLLAIVAVPLGNCRGRSVWVMAWRPARPLIAFAVAAIFL
jgi:hypothetical protein